MRIIIIIMLFPAIAFADDVRWKKQCPEIAIGAIVAAHIEGGIPKDRIRVAWSNRHFDGQKATAHVWPEVLIDGDWVPVSDLEIGRAHV